MASALLLVQSLLAVQHRSEALSFGQSCSSCQSHNTESHRDINQSSKQGYRPRSAATKGRRALTGAASATVYTEKQRDRKHFYCYLQLHVYYIAYTQYIEGISFWNSCYSLEQLVKVRENSPLQALLKQSTYFATRWLYCNNIALWPERIPSWPQDHKKNDQNLLFLKASFRTLPDLVSLTMSHKSDNAI